MRSIIGLTGYAGSGKDEAAQVLVKEQGYVRVSFAEPLKNALLKLDPLVSVASGSRVSAIVKRLGWGNAKVDYPEIRELLQRMGTEVGRNLFGENFWVDQARSAINKLNPNLPVVLTDVRFPNEVDMVRDLGGHIIRVVRPGYGPVNNHISDTGQDALKADMTVYNNGTIDELHLMVETYADVCVRSKLARTRGGLCPIDFRGQNADA